MSAWSLAQQPLAQQPYPYYPGGPAPVVPGTAPQYPTRACSFTEPAAQLSIRDQSPSNFQTEIVRPIPARQTIRTRPPLAAIVDRGFAGSLGASSPPARKSCGRRLRRFRARSRRRAGACGSPAVSESARAMFQSLASPFDPTQFRLPTLGLPPGLGTPEPTPEIKRQYGQFVEREIAPENTIQVVVGRAKVIVLREKPRRIYIPDENVAGFQVVTDQEFAVVGKKAGRTVLDLWFPDPRDPSDQRKDRTLSYMVVVLPDPERAAPGRAGRTEAFGGAGESLRASAQSAGTGNQAGISRQRRATLAGGRTSRGARRVEGHRRGGADPPHRRGTYADAQDAAGSSPGASTWLLSRAWATSRRPSTPSANCWRETPTSSTSCASPANSRSCSWSRWPKSIETPPAAMGINFA